MGYHRAGFDEIVGVDIKPQPRYPFEFVQADAMTYPLDGFDAIHASPPCQAYSVMASCRPENAYPDLVAAVRERVDGVYVIENVIGAPLRDPVVLCGQMFGLDLYRHRGFESSVAIPRRHHPVHVLRSSRAGHWEEGTVMSVAGHVAPIAKAREVMGIDWMNREELAEAIPPMYTEYIGRALLAHLA